MLIFDLRTKRRESLSDIRKNAVGSRDRSARIRTYNYPQVTNFNIFCEATSGLQYSCLCPLQIQNRKIDDVEHLQGRITDHRIGLTIYGMEEMMNGSKLDGFIQAMHIQDQMNQLQD